jgi:hypothetical protein
MKDIKMQKKTGKRKIFYNFHKLENSRIGFEHVNTPLQNTTTNPAGKRLKLYYISEENKKEDLIIAPEGSEFFSSGIKEDAFSKNQNSQNYNIPLFINVEDEKVQNFCSSFDSIYEKCVNYIFENKKELGIRVNDKESIKEIFKYPLFKIDNKKFDNKQFMLYPKLIIKHEDSISKVWSEFFEKTEDGKLVQCDFESLENTRIYVYPAILVDSLYINRPNTALTQISLQCKLSEAIVKRIQEKNEPSLKIFVNNQETDDPIQSQIQNVE